MLKVIGLGHFSRIYRRLKSKCKLILYFTPNWPISTPIVALFKYFLHYCIRIHQTNQFRRKSLLDSYWIMGNSWQQIDSIVLITLGGSSLLATAIEQVINEQWRQIRCRKILLCGILKVKCQCTEYDRDNYLLVMEKQLYSKTNKNYMKKLLHIYFNQNIT